MLMQSYVLQEIPAVIIKQSFCKKYLLKETLCAVIISSIITDRKTVKKRLRAFNASFLSKKTTFYLMPLSLLRASPLLTGITQSSDHIMISALFLNQIKHCICTMHIIPNPVISGRNIRAESL